MITTKYGALVLLLISGIAGNGQTPEQQKAVTEIEAIAAEMQRKGDSIMNTPEVKKMMEQAKKMEAAQKAKQESESVDVRPLAETNVATSSNTDYLKDFIISKGSSKKFDNWKSGSAELYVIKYLPFGKDPKTQYKIGSIDADGSFDFTMPEKIVCENKISDFFKCPNMGSPPPETEYSDPIAMVGARGVAVIKNGKRIGNIGLATSRQQAYNNSPAHQFRGDSGYRLSWWFAEQPSSAKVVCDRIYDNYGEQFEMRVIYDLEFKPGWNLIKTEVLEAHSPKFYKIQQHSIVTTAPSDAKWIFQEIRLNTNN